MTSEEQEHLKKCAAAAEHIADAAREMVFRMLTEGGLTADSISATLGLGIMVGPSWLIQQAKAYAIGMTGLQTQPKPTIFHSEERSTSDDDPCQN